LGDREAEGLGGLEVDDQLELRRLLDGEVRWPDSFENPIDVERSTLVQRVILPLP
jgi:hypothetical protein